MKNNRSVFDRIADLRKLAEEKKFQKMPRHYADEIIGLKTKEERNQAIEKLPEDIRQIVKFLVYDAWAKRHRQPLKSLKEISP